MTALAEARNVTMRFGDFTAVDRVSLKVDGGEIVGLIGANGAGKTTVIRMLLGLLIPSHGKVELFVSPPTMTSRSRVGYVPQSLGLYDDMTVQENWNFTSAAFRSGRQALPESVSDSKDRLVGSLPLGLQRRLAFAVAFSHRPELLVLDEPTSGVGPLNSTRLWQDIRESSETGIGVLVTTHAMEEAEQCDRLILMVGGRIAAQGTLAQLIGKSSVVEITTDNWRRAYEALDAEGFIVQVAGDVLRVPGRLDAVEEVMVRNDLRARATLVPANLEETFVMLVSEKATR